MRRALLVVGSTTFLLACGSANSGDGGLTDGSGPTGAGGTGAGAGGSGTGASAGTGRATGGSSTGGTTSGTGAGGTTTAGPGAGGTAGSPFGGGGTTAGGTGPGAGPGGSGAAGTGAGAGPGAGGTGTAGTGAGAGPGTGGTGAGGTSSGPPTDCNAANGGVGCCDGSNLYYCDQNGMLTNQPCGAMGCGWNASNNWYDCGFNGADPAGQPLMCGGSGAGAGGTSSGTGGTSSGTGGTGPVTGYDCPGDAGDPFADARKECVKTINAHRATLNLAPYKRWCGNATCEDKQPSQDAAKNTAHSAFGQCQEWAQNECPGWPDSPLANIDGCLQMMWDEGPGGAGCDQNPTCFEMHGHWINMSSTKYTMVECGFAETGGGKWWGVQDFK